MPQIFVALSEKLNFKRGWGESSRLDYVLNSVVGIGRVGHELVFTNKYLNVSNCLVAKDAGVKL